MIDIFATRYGLDPDLVYSQKSFDTVTNVMIMIKRKGEYQDRVNELERLKNSIK